VMLEFESHKLILCTVFRALQVRLYAYYTSALVPMWRLRKGSHADVQKLCSMLCKPGYVTPQIRSGRVTPEKESHMLLLDCVRCAARQEAFLTQARPQQSDAQWRAAHGIAHILCSVPCMGTGMSTRTQLLSRDA
jgi:hypothetical protein